MDTDARANRLVRPLPEGPVDVVGDVHGEAGLLEVLLERLGYGPDGAHPKGRRLVFVGDLVDWGPDSPAVLERVMPMVQAGRASCILGNHELNLVEGKRRDGNAWFYGEDNEAGRYPSRPMPPQLRDEALSFFAGLPLALERPGLRVVHAAWHGPSVQALREAEEGWPAIYAAAEANAWEALRARGIDDDRVDELNARHGIYRQEGRPPYVEELALNDLLYQMENPVRVLVSGLEEEVERPFFAGGRWRMVGRVKWWESYEEPEAVIVGHYWRSPDPARFSYKRVTRAHAEGEGEEERIFAGIGPLEWFGARGNVFCVDYCAGARYAERLHRAEGPFLSRLAAMRMPERQVVMVG